MKRAQILAFFCLAICFLPACSLIPSRNNGLPTPTPRIKYPGDVLLLDDNGTATLEFENGETKTSVNAADLKGMFAARTKTEGHVEKVLIVPGPETPVSIVNDTAGAVGPFYTTSMSARVTNDLNAFITWLGSEDIPAGLSKPNPLTLVVEIDDGGEIFLNREPAGSLSNPARLRDTLAGLFKSRTDNGVFRPGADVIETTVLIKLTPSMHWRDIGPVAVKIREAGSDHIGILRKEFDLGLPVEIRSLNDREVRIGP
jgi:hypothetical protein